MVSQIIQKVLAGIIVVLVVACTYLTYNRLSLQSDNLALETKLNDSEAYSASLTEYLKAKSVQQDNQMKSEVKGSAFRAKAKSKLKQVQEESVHAAYEEVGIPCGDAELSRLRKLTSEANSIIRESRTPE